eukprot:GFYU01002243.1.p1 GENE.GFYU01002243.1~~GFYU01002243.1.p1  ORF type:complete len:345 (+),score=128.66 GFYU01002243.1:35-1036(+)
MLYKTAAFLAFLSSTIAFGFSEWGRQYESLSAVEKLRMNWDRVIQDTTPSGWYGTLDTLSLFTEDIWLTGERISDEFPEGRKKLIHTVGTIAQIKLDLVDNKYTGLFNGADHGFVRASCANAPSEAGWFSDKTMVPGVSLKFFRDGVPSANMFLMYALQGQNDFNFFANPFASSVSGKNLDLKLKAVKAKFECASAYAGQISWSEWAEYDQSGKEETSPAFPFAVVLQPNPELSRHFDSTQDYKIEDSFARYFQGDETLYKMYALDSPTSQKLELLGEIKLTSKFTSSQYADKGMFFKHTWFEEALKLRPDWEDTFDREDLGIPKWRRMIPQW